MFQRYGKFIFEVLATVGAGIVAALYDDTIDANEWVGVLILGLGAIGVLGAGNLPEGIWSYTKTIVAAATAGALVLQTAILTPGLSTSELIQIGLAILGGFGVLAGPAPRVDTVEDDPGEHSVELGKGRRGQDFADEYYGGEGGKP